MELFYKNFGQLCTLAQESLDNDIGMFYTSTIFVNQLMSPIQFNNQINMTSN
jgi:hypothetical protein